MNELECHTLIFLNSQRGWNERGGGAKVAKSINVEGGILWKNWYIKRGVDGVKNLRNQ
mgnify:CR=1 FL=1